MAAKTQTINNPTPAIILVLLILIAALAYWFGFAGGKYETKRIMKDEQTIESQTDLNEASDELESMDPDALDQGLNDLQLEITQY